MEITIIAFRSTAIDKIVLRRHTAEVTFINGKSYDYALNFVGEYKSLDKIVDEFVTTESVGASYNKLVGEGVFV
jgi:hypothetical protein